MTNLKTRIFVVAISFCLIVWMGFWMSGVVISHSTWRWIFEKAELPVPKGSPAGEVFKQSWLFARASFVEAHFLASRADAENMISNKFIRFDPVYDCQWNAKCRQKNMNWSKWREQRLIFGRPARLDHAFKKFGKNFELEKLSTNFFYRVGNVTGSNPYVIAVDSLTGNTWIRVDTP